MKGKVNNSMYSILSTISVSGKNTTVNDCKKCYVTCIYIIFCKLGGEMNKKQSWTKYSLNI